MSTRLRYLITALGAAGAIWIGADTIGYADPQSATPQLTTKGPTVITPTDSSVKEKLTDNSFVEKAALSSMRDTELSNLALKKSQNKKLKKFAQKVGDASSTRMEKLKAVASTYRLEIPQQPSADQRAMIDQMQKLTGPAFDQAFVDVIKKVQDTTVGLYDNAAGQGTLNAELRVFAHQQLPLLRKNQKLAHALEPSAPSSANAKSKKALTEN